jgi:hypothetical protein
MRKAVSQKDFSMTKFISTIGLLTVSQIRRMERHMTMMSISGFMAVVLLAISAAFKFGTPTPNALHVFCSCIFMILAPVALVYGTVHLRFAETIQRASIHPPAE